MKQTRAIQRLERRTRRLLEIRRCFRSFSFMLDDGVYYFKDHAFHPASRKERINLLRTIRIRSGRKYPVQYTQGHYYITKEHFTFVFDDCTYQLSNASQRYDAISTRIKAYADRLPYQGIRISVDDDNRMIITSTVHGENWFNGDEEQFQQQHFHEVMDYLFESLGHAEIQTIRTEMNGTVYDVYSCVQHGDVLYDNIILTDDGPVLIDIGEIDLFPLFYDVFFYAVHSQSIPVEGGAFAYFRTAGFMQRVKETCAKLGIEYYDGLIDLYLAAQVWFRIREREADAPQYFVDHYVDRFEKADLQGFPMTQEAVGEYRKRKSLIKY